MKVSVEPNVLNWACQRSGLDASALLKKFPKLSEWQDGISQPTLKQLEDFARKTHVPLGLLFLPEPPQEQLPITDFRTLGGMRLKQPSPNLLETIYICQQRQDWYRNYLQTEGLSNRNHYVGSVTLKDDITKVAAQISDALQFDLKFRKKSTTWIEAQRIFIRQVENLDILVMISGVVGNNTQRKLDPEEFRGFALVDSLAPLIFINGCDTKAAQMFTLAHELAHIWLGEGGVSNIQPTDIYAQQSIESWCNQVAAELLVPFCDLKGEYQADNSLDSEVARLSKLYKVSSLVILRRIYDLGEIDRDRLEYGYSKALQNFQSKQNRKGGGGDFYRTLRTRVSHRFLKAVVASTLEGKTLFRDTFKMLGIKNSETFDKITQSLEAE